MGNDTILVCGFCIQNVKQILLDLFFAFCDEVKFYSWPMKINMFSEYAIYGIVFPQNVIKHAEEIFHFIVAFSVQKP